MTSAVDEGLHVCLPAAMGMGRWRQQLRAFAKTVGGSQQDPRLILAAFLQKKRKQLLQSSQYGGSKNAKSRAKRLARAYQSRVLKALSRHGERRRIVKSPQLLLYRSRPDYLRDKLCPDFNDNWVDIGRRLKDKFKDRVQLKDFSFARNPKSTLDQIKSLVEKASKSVELRIDFIDTTCDDVAPYIVLSHLMRSLPPIFSGGQINLEVAAVLESVGLDKALGMGGFTTTKHREKLILPFPMMHRAPPGFFGDEDHQLRPQYKEFVADKFCNALDGWLSTHDAELTPEAAESLTSSITEALDNAERHGAAEIDGGMGDWSMAGFSRLVVTSEAEIGLECSVSIVSVGSTISSSLETAAPDVSARIDQYVSTHVGLGAGSGQRRLLRTVMALQDGVTRVSAASDAGRGGVGLMTLVNLFADLGDTDAPDLQSVFTILSGSSCLRITSPYRRGVMAEGTTLRELWLNEHNDPVVIPSANHAFTIRDDFAGTIISACFTIDPVFLRRNISE